MDIGIEARGAAQHCRALRVTGTEPMPITTEIRDRIAEIVFDVPPVNAFDSETWMSCPPSSRRRQATRTSTVS
jgi:hypothetical protein